MWGLNQIIWEVICIIDFHFLALISILQVQYSSLTKGAIIFVTSVGAVQEGEMFCQLLQHLTLYLHNFLLALNQFFGCHDSKWAKRWCYMGQLAATSFRATNVAWKVGPWLQVFDGRQETHNKKSLKVVILNRVTRDNFPCNKCCTKRCCCKLSCVTSP